VKVLILSTMYPNSKIYQSGVFVHQQVKELIKLGVDVTVAAPVPYSPKWLIFLSKKRKLFREIPPFEIIDDINVYHSRYLALPGGLLKHFWGFIYIILLRRCFKKFNIKMNFDLIHAHGSIPNDHVAYLLSKKIKIPYIITVHGETVFSLLKKKRQFRIAKLALQNAKAVIGVSSKVMNRIEKFYHRTKNIYMVFNGFSFYGSLTSPGSEKSILNILMVATLIERKGCEYLLRAFKDIYDIFPNTKLTIVGGGELLDKMKNLADNLNISDRTRFTGTLSHKEVLSEISLCDIFTLPSWDEAFGVVYLEAMSLKKPIIGTRGEGITDIVIDGVNGLLVDAKNVLSLVDKISLLLNDDEKRKQIGNKGFDTIKNLTWEKNAYETFKVYEKVIFTKQIPL